MCAERAAGRPSGRPAPLEVGAKAKLGSPRDLSPLLPCKDNQVYVKYVCSFDSPRYLINSITPHTIVPQVFEMRIETRFSNPVNHC